MAKILLADDDPQVRTVLGKFIELAGHELLLATNGSEAIDFLSQHQTDLLILDVIMPEKDGFEVIISLLKKAKRPGIIAISGDSRRYGLDMIIQLTEKLGVNEVLVKPISQNALLAAIDRVLAATEVR